MRGCFVNQMFSLSDFSESFCLTDDAAMELLWDMKKIGYEVRSRKTNASFGYDQFLIPYPIPTLSKYSVQKKKDLF